MDLEPFLGRFGELEISWFTRGENRPPSTILDDAGLYLGAFHLCDTVERRQTPCPPITLVRWSKPVDGLKLKVDAACRPGMEVVLVSGGTKRERWWPVLRRKLWGTAECLARREGLEFAACGV